MGFHASAMKTQFLSTYNYYQKYYTYRQNSNQDNKIKPIKPNTRPETQVSFIGKRYADFFIRSFNLNPILHFEKFTKSEYARLSSNEIQQLRQNFTKMVKKSNDLALFAFDDIHNICPVILKDMFDKFFGAGEYVVITLGRSLSTIGKALGYKLGEDKVINIPMSWARRFAPESTRIEDHFTVYNKLLTEEGLYQFKNYLSKLGLSKTQVETSGKNYILMDYCFSGTSLKGAEFLFKSDYIWGPNAKIFAVDFLEALSKYNIPNMKNSFIPMSPESLLYRTFCGSRLKSYSFVSRALRLDKTEKASMIPTLINRNIEKERNLVWFKLLDNAMQPQNIEVPERKVKLDNSISIQKVAPWSDSIKQAETDIRNDIQRVNFQIIKIDALDNWENKTINKLRKDLIESYNFLTDFYNTYQNNPYSIIEYYHLRNKIHGIIKNAESTLPNTGIYNNLSL